MSHPGPELQRLRAGLRAAKAATSELQRQIAAGEDFDQRLWTALLEVDPLCPGPPTTKRPPSSKAEGQ